MLKPFLSIRHIDYWWFSSPSSFQSWCIAIQFPSLLQSVQMSKRFTNEPNKQMFHMVNRWVMLNTGERQNTNCSGFEWYFGWILWFKDFWVYPRTFFIPSYLCSVQRNDWTRKEMHYWQLIFHVYRFSGFMLICSFIANSSSTRTPLKCVRDGLFWNFY